MLIDFNETDEIRLWTVINDEVMGGVSQSRFALSPAATGIFSGQLSLEPKKISCSRFLAQALDSTARQKIPT